MLGGVGQEGQMAGPLDGHRQAALVLGAGPRLAAGLYLAPIREKAGEEIHRFVVYPVHPADAEVASLALWTSSSTTSSLITSSLTTSSICQHDLLAI